MLKSSGAESILTTINILWDLYRDQNRDDFIREAEEAIQGLARLGFIKPYRWDEPNPLPAEEAMRWLAATRIMQWEEGQEYWVWAEKPGHSPGIEYVLTDEGQQALAR